MLIATHGYVADILPAYNILQEHLNSQLEHFTAEALLDEEGLWDTHGQKTMLQINTMNAQSKLKKYRGLLSAPVYPTALVLVPWNKWTYLEDVCDFDQLEGYKTVVQAFWDDNYAVLDIGEPVVEEEVAESAIPAPVSSPPNSRD